MKHLDGKRRSCVVAILHDVFTRYPSRVLNMNIICIYFATSIQ